MRSALLLLLLPFLLFSCDSVEPVEPEPEPGPDPAPLVPTTSRAGLSPRVLNLSLDSDGFIQQYFATSDSTTANVLFAGSLWMSGQQDGELRVAAARNSNPQGTNFGPCEGELARVYSVSQGVEYSDQGWPSAAGAPTTSTGAPMAYGDQMVWTSNCQQEGGETFDQPFSDLRVNTAVFGHERYPSAVFVRFEMRNESGSDITDAKVGFWTDPDIRNAPSNLTGVKVDSRLAYVYLSPDVEDRGEVAGTVVLETPGDAPLLAHRIVDKRGETFGMSDIDGAEDFDFALRGLDNDGQPMIDPITNVTSTFAYTGDPVALDGWLDGFDGCGTYCVDGVQVGEEVRQLISAGPFTLASGETKTFTIAYLVQTGPSLGGAFGRLRGDADVIRSDPSLWRFVSQ